VPETAQADAARTDAARADAAWARTDGDWADHEWPADGADGVGRGLAMVADLADMDAEGGRGLALVAALAHSWGYRDVPPPRCAVPSDAIPSGAVPRDAVPSGAGPGVPVSSALAATLAASAHTTAMFIQVGGGFSAGNETMYLDNLRATNLPEPASLSMLGLGGLTMLRRRRR